MTRNDVAQYLTQMTGETEAFNEILKPTQPPLAHSRVATVRERFAAKNAQLRGSLFETLLLAGSRCIECDNRDPDEVPCWALADWPKAVDVNAA